MPGRIIALYVILCLRCLTNGTALVKSFPPGTPAAIFTNAVATIDFSACFFMLIALYQMKVWVVLLFRIYVGIMMPFSLFLMAATAIVKERNGEAMPWAQFVGGFIVAVGFGLFAWYVGQRKTRDYLQTAASSPNQSTEPTP